LGVAVFAFWRGSEPVNGELAAVGMTPAAEAPAAPKVVKLGIAAPRRELKPDETMQLALRGRFSDGSENEVADAVEWLSSNSQVAAVDGEGRLTALQPGTAAITAIHGGVESAAWTIAVKAAEPKPSPAPKLVTLAVNANKKELWPREKLTLRVTGSYSDGSKKNLSNGVIWASSDAAVAAIKPGGELEALRAGRTEVVARVGEVASAPLWVAVKEAVAKPVIEPQERKRWESGPGRTPTSAVVEKATEPRASAPYVNADQARAKVASYITRARDYRVRGDYGSALAELGRARATDPNNTDVRAEIEQTRRACLAEKRLGRGDLDCG
jgi:hypothetical protein